MEMANRVRGTDDDQKPVVCVDDMQVNDQLLFRCLRCRQIRSSLKVKAWSAEVRATPLADLLDAGRLRCVACGDAPASAEVMRIVVTVPTRVFSWNGPNAKKGPAG